MEGKTVIVIILTMIGLIFGGSWVIKQERRAVETVERQPQPTVTSEPRITGKGQCESTIPEEPGPELTATENLTMECGRRLSKEECLKIDYYDTKNNNMVKGDGIPDCVWR